MTNYHHFWGVMSSLIDWIYPIGAVVASVNKQFDPNKLYTGGGGGAHNNLQPYQTVYYWTRTT